jgi:hypothetical protein
MDTSEQARLARIERHRQMAALPNLVIPAPIVRINRKTRRQARNSDNAANVVALRGFNRGAANQWRARNNRKISRIAARV